MNSLRGSRTMLHDSLTRDSRRSGPCIVGGVSPSLHHARQSVTGPIFTGAVGALPVSLQLGFVEPKLQVGPLPLSSGPTQSQDQTKASRPESLVFPFFPSKHHIKKSHRLRPCSSKNWETRAMKALRGRRTVLHDFLMRGSSRSGPCIVGGVSLSLHHARQSVTGPIFTGPALTIGRGLQLGFVEPKPRPMVVPASSGPTQSQDQTKASWPEPLDFPLFTVFYLSPRGESVMREAA
jgi:hypothetical protein